MAPIHDQYERLYRTLKAEAVQKIDAKQISASRKTELRERVRSLPHPDVATAYDIREVCEEIQAGPLEYLYELGGEQASSILSQLEEQEPPTDRERTHRDQETDLEQVQQTLNYQTMMLRDIATQSGQAAQGINRTLKSNCVNCGSDLLLYVDQTGTVDDLVLSCRDCDNEWPLRSVP